MSGRQPQASFILEKALAKKDGGPCWKVAAQQANPRTAPLVPRGAATRAPRSADAAEGSGESNRGSKQAPGKPKPPGTAAAKEVVPPKETIDVSKKKPAAKDVVQDKDEGVPRMKAAAKESEGGARKKKTAAKVVAPTHATSPDTAVAEVVADMVAFVDNVATAVPSRPPAPASVGPRPSSRKSNQVTSRKRCRAVLQGDSDNDDEVPSSEEAEEDNGDAEASTFTIPTSVVDADTNLMVEGANQCTGLNSDEDPELCEEPEEDEEEDNTGDDDAWHMDWDIGSLTDEDSDEEMEELPDSVWLSFAKHTQ
ncbi:hypothetical protein PI124_g2569 [Phytophthora idaei]|nr:hypothetical protein PI124_g2569 [Phytophthora idaei]